MPIERKVLLKEFKEWSQTDEAAQVVRNSLSKAQKLIYQRKERLKKYAEQTKPVYMDI